MEERAVDNVGMPDHPADIGSCPEDLAGLHTIDVLHAPEQGNEVTAIIPEHPLGLSGSPRCVEEVERVRCCYRNAPCRCSLQEGVPCDVPAVFQRRGRLRALDDHARSRLMGAEIDRRIEQGLVGDDPFHFDPAGS